MLENSLFEAAWLRLIFSLPLSASCQENAYDAKDEAAETDESTAWHIDNMYDIGLMIGGGSTNIQKNIIGERGLGLPREPKAAAPPARG